MPVIRGRAPDSFTSLGGVILLLFVQFCFARFSIQAPLPSSSPRLSPHFCDWTENTGRAGTGTVLFTAGSAKQDPERRRRSGNNAGRKEGRGALLPPHVLLKTTRRGQHCAKELLTQVDVRPRAFPWGQRQPGTDYDGMIWWNGVCFPCYQPPRIKELP